MCFHSRIGWKRSSEGPAGIGVLPKPFRKETAPSLETSLSLFEQKSELNMTKTLKNIHS